MEEFKMTVDWVIWFFMRWYNFFMLQPPVIQIAVFMPLALLVLSLFLGVVKFLKGRL